MHTQYRYKQFTHNIHLAKHIKEKGVHVAYCTLYTFYTVRFIHILYGVLYIKLCSFQDVYFEVNTHCIQYTLYTKYCTHYTISTLHTIHTIQLTQVYFIQLRLRADWGQGDEEVGDGEVGDGGGATQG